MFTDALSTGFPTRCYNDPLNRMVLVVPVMLVCLTVAGLSAQELSAEHQRLDFLVGEWRTVSEFPDGTTAEGDLEYSWVLDGRYMRVEFHGEHPAGRLWEAHVMQKYDPERGEYVSWSFYSADDPVIYTGSVLDNGVYRISTEAPGGTIGIDYRPEGSGVYQENWFSPEGGERRVTLRTRYYPADG